MTAFLVAAAVLVAVALAFVVPVLVSGGSRGRVSRDRLNTAVYRDQLRELDADLAAGTLSPEHYDKARRELEARLLADVATADVAPAEGHRSLKAAVLAAVAVPLTAGTIYLFVGAPQALSPGATAARDAADTVTAEQIAAMVEKLASRLKQNPEDAEGWAMLGRAYGVLGRLEDSAAAYGNAVQRSPGNAQLLTDYADALAAARGRNLAGEPEKLLAQALAIDPQQPKALALGGTAAFQRGDYAQAAALWERLLARVPAGSELAKAVQASIDEARAASAKGGAPPTR